MSQYRTGTVSVTQGSPIVNGAGTAWINEVGPGDLFTTEGQVWYQVSGVTSNGQMTLAAPWAGASASGQSYAITRDFTPNYGWPYPNKGDVETASIVKLALAAIDAKLAELGAAPGGLGGNSEVQADFNDNSQISFTLGSTASYRAWFVDYTLDAGTAHQVGRLYVVHDGTNVAVRNEFTGVPDPILGVSFAGAVVAGAVDITAQAQNVGANLKLKYAISSTLSPTV